MLTVNPMAIQRPNCNRDPQQVTVAGTAAASSSLPDYQPANAAAL